MEVRMKITKEFDKDIKDTKTTGSKSYIVALQSGGLMEDPGFHYSDYQLIRAENEDEAVEKYNKLNKCGYFYGSVISDDFEIMCD